MFKLADILVFGSVIDGDTASESVDPFQQEGLPFAQVVVQIRRSSCVFIFLLIHEGNEWGLWLIADGIKWL
jgi:hypothetical protein